MSGSHSNRKGKRGERELANLLREKGYTVQRTPQSGGAHIPGDLIGTPGLHWEVKRQETARYPEWLRQAIADCPRGKLPVVAHRRNGEDWTVALPLEAFLLLYERVVPPSKHDDGQSADGSA